MAQRFLIPLIILLSVFFTSCHTHRKAQRRAAKERAANAGKSGNKTTGGKYTTEDYINKYHKAAIKQMKSHGIPASITLAQGILESANGNSELARNANNHFGIKCTKDWKGKTYYHYASEGNSCFRRYPNVEASYEDHAAFLQYKRYAFLFELKSKDYKGWAKGLKKAGYATNPKYPELLINLIEKYDLHNYDK
jgi:flagellum-specific peptidoglycan hydrolase FlgJ